MSAAVDLSAWEAETPYDRATRAMLHLTRKAARQLEYERYEAVRRAVRAVVPLGRLHRSRLEAHDRRADLCQRLALRLLSEDVEDVEAWARVAARNLVSNDVRDEARRRELDTAYGEGTAKRYRSGPNFRPTWYPPHGKPCDPPNLRPSVGDPFACEGARVMHVKGSPDGRNREEEKMVRRIHAYRVCCDSLDTTAHNVKLSERHSG